MAFTPIQKGYGYQYGNYYGGFIPNKFKSWVYDKVLTFFTIQQNGTEIAYVNMNDSVTHFTSTKPTVGSASNGAKIKFDGSNQRWDFIRINTDDTEATVARIDSTGLVSIT